MIGELGNFCLIVALFASILLAIIPLMGIGFKKVELMRTAKLYVGLQFLGVSLAYFSLSLCFLVDDFSVIYVANNSSRLLPWFYKLCAVWGGHEGSMLLWVAILSFWMVLVSIFSPNLEKEMQSRILVVLGWLSAGFILFLLATSNPFLRQFELLNTEGRDLNPLLQDPGFLFHPPLLYMGYVGLSVAFSFAIAALWAGKVERNWLKWTRPWTLAAWCCLTLGITLGSWWAYRELGWGGWWFWDPVENASFMPWLVGTALLHSLAVTEKRQQFKSWTLLLAITAFSLSLIGTFLVRSGVLTSVHAFAVDPDRGLFILGFLVMVIGGSLLLFLWRAPALQRQPLTHLFCRESALLLNNVFLVVLMLTVLMGTTYPLIIDGLHLGKLSVGAPYFNAVFVPLVIPMLLLMGLGTHLRWLKEDWRQVGRRLSKTMLLSIVLPVIALLFTAPHINYSALMGLILGCWLIFSTVQALSQQGRARGFLSISQAYWGMVLAHLGVAVTVIGIAISTAYGVQDDVPMELGSKIKLVDYTVTFLTETPITGPNYKGTRAEFQISHYGKEATIYPEKRIYTVGQMPMTESAIDVSPFRDIYIALGEPLTDSSWSVRLYYKPFIRWIWSGGFLIFAGGLLALADRRYFKKRAVITEDLEGLEA